MNEQTYTVCIYAERKKKMTIHLAGCNHVSGVGNTNSTNWYYSISKNAVGYLIRTNSHYKVEFCGHCLAELQFNKQ